MKHESKEFIRVDAAVPQFTAPDVVPTAGCYRGVLGSRMEAYWSSPPVFAIVSRDAVEVCFNLADRTPFGTGRCRVGYDAYIRIAGIEALANEPSQRGAEIPEGPVVRIHGQRELVIKACTGSVRAFGEATPIAPPDTHRGGGACCPSPGVLSG